MVGGQSDILTWFPVSKAGERLQGDRSSLLPSTHTDAQRRCVWVVALAALPPGGGKSSFFAALKKVADENLMGAAKEVVLVSSDECKAACKRGGRGTNFNEALAKAYKRALTRSPSSSSVVIGYDKNIPDMANPHFLPNRMSAFVCV